MAQIQTKFIANSAVTLAKMANIANDTILGNNSGSSGAPIALSVAQVNAILPIFTSSLNGLAPASGGGSTNFLRADGTWAAPSGSGGTVTSVALADGSTSPIYSISGSPVTSSGTLTFTLSTQSANTVFAGPATGSAAQPTFRSLVAADIPSLSYVNTVGTFNSQSSSANGLVISGNDIYAQAATTSNPGMVSAPAAGGLALSTAALSINVDSSTTKINGSNQLESLSSTQQAITLASGDITNQYVDLAHPAFGSSASVNSLDLFVVGGPNQQKTVDYTVSLTGGAGGVTRVTFAGDLATGGNAALVSGDILEISYSYLG